MLEAGLHEEDLPGSDGCESLVLRTSVPKSVLFCCYFFFNRGKSNKSFGGIKLNQTGMPSGLPLVHLHPASVVELGGMSKMPASVRDD